MHSSACSRAEHPDLAKSPHLLLLVRKAPAADAAMHTREPHWRPGLYIVNNICTLVYTMQVRAVC